MMNSSPSAKRGRRLLWLGAFAVLAAAGSVAQPWTTPAVAQEQKKETVTREVGLPLQDAQKALQAKKYQEAIAKINEAAKVANKTPYDVYMIDQMKAAAYQGLKDWKNTAIALEAVIKSGRLTPAEAQQRSKAVALLYFQAGDKASAAASGKAYVRQYGADEDLSRILAQMAIEANNFAEAAVYAKQLIDLQVKKGEKPEEPLIKVLLAAAGQAKDPNAIFDAYALMLKHYPKPEYWRELVRNAQVEAGFDANTYRLDVYRLLVGAGVSLEAKERTNIAEDAILKGLPGEAKKTMEDGFAAKVLGTGPEAARHQRLLDTAKQKAASDTAELPGLETEARAAATGQALVVLGEDYFGYGQYQKAAALIQAGLAKGGLTNVNAARLRLGEAQFYAGDVAGARKTWATVTGKDGSSRLAKIWSLVTPKSA